MKRGFTFVELMFASAISLIVLSALIVAFGSIWTMMKESNDELQLALHARAVREQVLYRLDSGLAGLFYSKFRSATEVVTASSLVAGVEKLGSAQTGTSVETEVVETEAVALPENPDYPFVQNAQPETGNLFDNVYPYEFIRNSASTDFEPSLFRMNLAFPNNARRSLVYEDHLIVFVDGKVGSL